MIHGRNKSWLLSTFGSLVDLRNCRPFFPQDQAWASLDECERTISYVAFRAVELCPYCTLSRPERQEKDLKIVRKNGKRLTPEKLFYIYMNCKNVETSLTVHIGLCIL
ncbi:hypothetical protein F2P79_003154 [Pimephales promelas]|nr:hypothetical protein F2P79_003154 [Pimephales promelas]